MNKIILNTLLISTASTLTGHAALVTWGGAGSSGSAEYWNLPVTGGPGRNDDATHWNQPAPPSTDGTDDILQNGGGIKKDSGLTFANSDWDMNSGAYFRFNAGSFVANGGATIVLNDSSTIRVNTSGNAQFSGSATSITINAGSTLSINTGYFNTTGGTINLAGGTILSTGAQTNPIRATTGLGSGGLDFTELGGTIQIDNFTGGTLLDYLNNKAGTGFFHIDGTAVAGFGDTNKVGNEWIEFTGGATSGTLTLVTVPEPSSTALLGLGGLALILRRRK